MIQISGKGVTIQWADDGLVIMRHRDSGDGTALLKLDTEEAREFTMQWAMGQHAIAAGKQMMAGPFGEPNFPFRVFNFPSDDEDEE